MISPARVAAFDVLRGVHEGGFASELLLARCAALERRDAGLASQIVFGCLRFQGQLDFLIRHFAGRGPKLDPEVRIALRMGIYQMRYLERIPPHSAVSESVELVKRARKRSAAAFVNAILRKVHRDPVGWPDRATALSCPEWLLSKWEAQFGAEIAKRIAETANCEPELYVRAPGAGPGLEPTVVPGCYCVADGEPPPGVRIHDIASQSIVPLLELAPGLTFLDLCAAPGNKTAQALESGVHAIACDLHWRRLKNVAGCPRVVLDASRPLPFKARFDRILVDAPCSGTGTLARNPEIKWRLQPDDLARFQQLQIAILSNALSALAPGGRAVYSTCSLEREENEDVVAAVAARLPALGILEKRRWIPGRDCGDGFFAAVLAWT
ncbi:MAG TPA: transcription antitermination factor NusB [Bryobacteraceae bacterium]|jgi:16S rRNA (cytosine967-C5)-methyltransferase|nr:transcription antitermination factor NusB [Bryobacteraceae bacterium]